MKRKPVKHAKRTYVPAIEGTSPKLKGLVVSKSREHWKAKHWATNDAAIRLLRFIWMRQGLTYADRHKFHATHLGALLRDGLVEYHMAPGSKEQWGLKVTPAGEARLGN